MSLFKGIGIIFVVILLSAAGYMYYQQGQQKSSIKQEEQLHTTTKTNSATSISPRQRADWKTYTNTRGKYSLQYPSDYTLREGAVSSVDGVTAPAVDTIELTSPVIPKINTNITIRIKHYGTFKQPIDKMIESIGLTEEDFFKFKPYALVNIENASIYRDSPLGANGSTIINFLHPTTEEVYKGYFVTIVSHASYNDTEPYVKEILETWKFL